MKSVPLIIKSDSQYSIKCNFFLHIVPTAAPLLTEGCKGFTDWLPGWRRHNYTTSKGAPVKNLKLIMYMDALLASRGRSGQQVRLEYVRGHAGEVGNEGADALAVRGARLHEVEEPDWDALRLRLDEESELARMTDIRPADADMDISVSHPWILGPC